MEHPENESFLEGVSDEMKERIRQSMEEFYPRLKAQAERSLRLAQEMSGLWATTAKVMVDAFVAEGFSESDALKLTLELIPKKSI